MELGQKKTDECCFGPKGRIDVGGLIKRINDTMEKRANSELQSHDITFFQFKMLLTLHCLKDGTATLKELERYFGVAQSTAAGVAVRLERKQLIESFHAPGDRRVKCVRLTEAGRTLCESHRAPVEQGEADMLRSLSPEEQEQLKELLLRVYRSLCDSPAANHEIPLKG
ncbi:MAG: MarR family transcriptional regulator [Clostridiales bacterium]|nr:MarR family transcriptional regulator [Clostridiales bacterium]